MLLCFLPILAFAGKTAEDAPLPSPSAATPAPITTHALTMFGDAPKYAADFSRFEYVNPDAPKGGHVRLAAIGTYDSLNAYILKGVSASGMGLTVDTLLVSSLEEPFTKYGLLAESIILPADRAWVEFQLRKEARFHDGTPLTAEDAAFTFNALKTKGHPFYRSYYRDVATADVKGPHRIRFTFKNGDNRELPLILGQMPVLSKAYYTKHPFDKTSLEAPLGSGPYRVDRVEPGRSITYRRDPGYWAKDLPIHRGRYNIDRITYDYYRDMNVAVEALKAGEYDFRQENVSRLWATAYDTPAVTEGRMKVEEISHRQPTGMQGFVLNARKRPFSDRAFRRALQYAFDFEWTNKQLFYGAYTRTDSYFSNSHYAATGIPKGAELALLEPFRDRLPPELFTTPFRVPETDGSGNNRAQLREAARLLREAGWEVKDGKRIDPETGKPVTFQFLLVSPSFERVVAPILKNLERLGITADMRTVDAAQYQKRLEQFDFDVIANVFGQSLSPGNEQIDFWHSSTAATDGSRNLIGVNHPAVDALVERIVSAGSQAELTTAVRALDRVLLWQYYVIPNWHIRSYRLAYWSKLRRPPALPPYGMDFPHAWWVEEEAVKGGE